MCDQFASYRISRCLPGRFAGVAAALGILATAGSLLFAQAAPSVSEEAKAKLPIPPQANQQKLLDALDEIYEIDKKRTDEEKVKLIQELLEGIAETKNKPTDRFVLLRKAMELASDVGDAPLVFEMVDRIAADFQIDPLKTKGKMLQAMAKGAKTSERIASLVEASNSYIDQAVAQRRLDYALSIATLANRASQHPQGREFRKSTLDRYREVQKLRASYREFQEALVAVQANPDDADANLVVGQLYCFSYADWQRGLPHLVKGSDAELAGIARQELADPSEGGQQAKLADAWWGLAQRRKGNKKDILIDRASFWYEKARTGTLTGLTQIKVDKRLEEIAKMQSARTGTSKSTTQLPLAFRKGLVLHYSFDKDEGEKVTDKSEKENHGKVQGTKWVDNARGRKNGAYAFDGEGAYISIGNMGPASDKGTIMFWMYPAEIVNYRNPFTTRRHGGNVGFRFEENAAGNFGAVVGNDSGAYDGHTYTSALAAGTWYHVVLVWDKTKSKITGYLNGSLVFDDPNTLWATSFDDVSVGTGYSSSGGRQWKGGIDELMIFNRALTEQEVKQLYKIQGGTASPKRAR